MNTSEKMTPVIQVPAGVASSSSGPSHGGQSNVIENQMAQHQLEVASAEAETQRILESESDSENQEDNSGDEHVQANNDQGTKRKPYQRRYHRHTQHQIQEMEAIFQECPHPDGKRRKEIAQELGLDLSQVRFWFQNKRTLMKTQNERNDNPNLRAENEQLRHEHLRLKEALTNRSCSSCGGPPAVGDNSSIVHQLKMENIKLKHEYEQVVASAAKWVGKPCDGPLPPPRTIDVNRPAVDVFRTLNRPRDAEKPLIMEVAVAAMEEIIKMAQMAEPLWNNGIDHTTRVLNVKAYEDIFPMGIGPGCHGFKPEGSKETCVAMISRANLVEILMDVNQWLTFFSSIVSKAVTIDVLTPGVRGNYDGSLQLMGAEYQFPSPLVPTHESYFARYCKRYGEGRWVVVDVSLDKVLNPNRPINCRRRPSGCLIQEMPNGCSKIIWIEHIELEEGGVQNMYKPLVDAGLAFGAKRWVATLYRQCERLARSMATITPSDAAIMNQEGRKRLLKMGARLMRSFCSGVSASTTHSWTKFSGNGDDDIRIMTRKSFNELGTPPGIVASAAISFWLPIPPKRVFDFLRDERSRGEWDILSNVGKIEEAAYIATGYEKGNCLSVFRVKSANPDQNSMLILQESCTDSTASYVVYAPVDIAVMNGVLGGVNPDHVALLPSGFAILPDGPLLGSVGGNGETETGGTLLSVAFQILIDSNPDAALSPESVATFKNLIACTVGRIKASVAAAKPQ